MTRPDLQADKDHPSDNGRYLSVEEVRNRLNRMRDRLGGGGLSRPDAPHGGNPEPEETNDEA